MLPTSISAVFVKAKRVRIRSNPLGLGLLVDHQRRPARSDLHCLLFRRSVLPDQPMPSCPSLSRWDTYRCAWATSISFRVPRTSLPPRLCKWTHMGKPGFLPDSVMAWDRTPSTRPITTPARWTRFPRTSSPLCRVEVVTSPPGLTVNVDGQNHSKGASMLWAEGQTHHLIAPPTQTDATGRPWTFVGWSQGGTADQTYTVPVGQFGLYLVATYQPAGKLQMTQRSIRVAFHSRRRGLHHALCPSQQTHRCAGASGCAPIGGAGRLQPLHFRFLEWRKHRHFVPGHHWRSGAGLHRNVSTRSIKSPPLLSRPTW